MKFCDLFKMCEGGAPTNLLLNRSINSKVKSMFFNVKNTKKYDKVIITLLYLAVKFKPSCMLQHTL